MSKYFQYTACGLDNVWLANGFKVKVTRHGNAVAVNDVDGLHKLIAETLIDKPGRLTGKEFRFLRTQLGLSQEALGAMLDFSENAVSLWERKDTVPATCDQWLRMLVPNPAPNTLPTMPLAGQVQICQIWRCVDTYFLYSKEMSTK